jgi:GT2 family glycosyltransferase/glycosyltransferase involved in cell wall biosynthesis
VVVALAEHHETRRLGWRFLELGLRARQATRMLAYWSARPLREEIGRAVRDASQQGIAFATVPDPMVSVVIPVFNNWALTRQCLGSLCAASPTAMLEVIVVDDASTDETHDALQAIEGIRALRNAQNRGFTLSANAGARVARGEYVLFLNNDTVMLNRCVPNLLEALEDPGVAAVGAKLVYPNGRLQEAGSLIWRDGSGWNIGKRAGPLRPEYNFRREVDYCSAAALMVRKRFLDEVGYFDERFAPAYYEDTDLGFEIRARGCRIVVEPSAVVVHLEGMTHGTDTRKGLQGAPSKAYQSRNRERFVAKRALELQQHIDRPSHDVAELVGSRRQTLPRVLVCERTVPAPDRDSGSSRMAAMLQSLAPLTSRLTMFPRFGASNPRYVRPLQNAGIEVMVPTPRSFSHFLRSRRDLYDVVLLSRSSVAKALLAQVRRHAPGATVVFDTVDLESLRLGRERAVSGRPSESDVRRARQLDRGLIAASDLTVTVSEAEATVVRELVPAARTVVLPNVHQIRVGTPPPFAVRRGLLFIGDFAHRPNIDAMAWLASEVLPLIRERLQVECVAAGSNPPASLIGRYASNIRFTGWVPEVEALFDAARVFVAPLRFGAGMKGKIGQAMALGLPIVTTTVGAEGMDLEDGKDALIRDDPSGFADAVLQLHENEALWSALSSAAVEAVRSRWTPALMRARLEHMLETASRTRSQKVEIAR